MRAQNRHQPVRSEVMISRPQTQVTWNVDRIALSARAASSFSTSSSSISSAIIVSVYRKNEAARIHLRWTGPGRSRKGFTIESSISQPQSVFAIIPLALRAPSTFRAILHSSATSFEQAGHHPVFPGTQSRLHFTQARILIFFFSLATRGISSCSRRTKSGCSIRYACT